MAGMSGFDWATYKDNTFGVNADLSIPIVFDEAPTLPQNAALDEYESVEGLSGTRFNDVLKGSNTLAEERLPAAQGGTEGYQGSFLDAQGIGLIAGLQGVLGSGVNFYNAGDIILGGDGSDLIQGNAGDDIIDGDKWLNVRIGVMTGWNANGPTGAERTFELVNGLPQEIKSMTSQVTLRLDAAGSEVATGGTLVTKPLSAWMFEGRFNPGQLQIIREIKIDTTAGDIDTAKFQGNRAAYAFSATADGQVIVTDTSELNLDGSDRLRNIERVEFADNNPLNIIVGTPNNDVLNGTAEADLMLGLGGNDVLNGGAGDDILVGGPNAATSGGTFIDDFGGAASYTDNNGTLTFNGGWVESGGETPTSPTAGDININGGRLRFQGDGGIDGGETITRAANLSGLTAATVSFAWEGDDLDAGETVQVQAFNGTTWDNLGTALGGDQTGNFSAALTAAQIGAHTAIRFVANGSFDAGENFFVDNFTITGSAVETLNGGAGNDTYSFAVGDGSDIINELANEGAADRISILVPEVIDPVTGLPVVDPATGLSLRTMTLLDANDNGGGTQDGDLVISYAMPGGTTQQITVANHFDQTNAQTGVERINFNGASIHGYQLGAEDYLISRLDPAQRTSEANGVNLATSTANNFIVGENGVDDFITGGLGNDLIFGGTGTNTLLGGLGVDLLVGGTGSDTLNGGDDIDSLVGGAGNDVYVDDTFEDLIVELANGGTDTVQTLAAAYSLELLANVENLSYEGLDADQFVGTGNALANTISGGDLADTLSGLAGNDTLQGGLGADTMIGGDGSDVYFVDETGDVVTETNADLAIGGTDRVESDIDYTLGANLENLDLNGAAVSRTRQYAQQRHQRQCQRQPTFRRSRQRHAERRRRQRPARWRGGQRHAERRRRQRHHHRRRRKRHHRCGRRLQHHRLQHHQLRQRRHQQLRQRRRQPCKPGPHRPQRSRGDRGELCKSGVRVGRRSQHHHHHPEMDAASAIQGTIQIKWQTNRRPSTSTDFTLATGHRSFWLAGRTVRQRLPSTETALAATSSMPKMATRTRHVSNGNGGNDTLSGGLNAAAVNFADNSRAANLGNSNGTTAGRPRRGRNRR